MAPIIKARGLYTNPNPLDLPEGAMTAATNVVIDRDNIVSPRRGLDELGTITDSKRLRALTSFADRVVAHWDDNGGSVTGQFSYWSGSAFTALTGQYDAPEVEGDSDDYRVRFAQAKRRLYATTSTGPVRIENSNGTPLAAVYAGGVKAVGFDRQNSSTSDSATGIISPQAACAWRAVIEYEDYAGVFVAGSPSPRCVLRNTNASGGSNKSATLRVLLPKQTGTASTALTERYWVALYRSSNSADLATPPLEDEALVHRQKLTDTDITTGYVDITDITPDSLRGAFGYWTTYQEGILQSNEPPPLARDLCVWKGALCYANTHARERLFLQMLGLPADSDTITIAGVTYTAKTTPSGSNEYKRETGGSPALTTSQEIELTAQNLCGIINGSTSNTSVYAYYLGDPSDPRSVGRFVVEARALGASAFTASTGAGITRAKWEPLPPPAAHTVTLQRATNVVTATVTAGAQSFAVGEKVTIGTTGGFGAGPFTITGVTGTTFTYAETGANEGPSASTTATFYTASGTAPATSTSDEGRSRIYFSKPDLPEAVPTLQYLDVGSGSNYLLRVTPVGDSLLAWVDKEGVFRISGEPPTPYSPGTLRVDVLDSTAWPLAPEAIDIMGDAVYALTIQGVVRATEAGVELVSRPVEKSLLDDIYASTLAVTRKMAWLTGYESDRRVIVSIPGKASAIQAEGQYVFNEVTGTWTKWNLARSAGFVNPTDDLLYMGATVAGSGSGTPNAGVYKERKARAAADHQDDGAAIACTITWAPLTAGEPAEMKLWRDAELHFASTQPTTSTITFSSELTGASASQAVATASVRTARALVPQEQRRCARLTVTLAVSQAAGTFDLAGLTVRHTGGGDKGVR